ncbi:MAG: hypothetical protein R8M46_05540, partial [Ghiorsea sp.]
MHFSKILKLTATSVVLAGSSLIAATAYASSGFEIVVNNALGSAISCSACHSGTPSPTTPTLPLALTYRAGATVANIANSDSDGDGFTNKQEASGTLTD